jgi:hypothetical protein
LALNIPFGDEMTFVLGDDPGGVLLHFVDPLEAYCTHAGRKIRELPVSDQP